MNLFSKKSLARYSIFCGICILCFAAFLQVSLSNAFASPLESIVYEGRLLDTSGAPLTGTYSFRLSFWKSSDFVPSDILGDGSINTLSANYSDWSEIHAVPISQQGTFSLQIGTLTALPEFDPALHQFLQVEVKADGAPLTSFQLMDPTGDAGVDTNDRNTIGSVPYSLYAKESSGSNEEIFILDTDNTQEGFGAGSIILQFGQMLGKILSYDLDSMYFRFNDSIHVEGDITLTGLVNGVDIANLPTNTHGQNTDTGTSSSNFALNMSGNTLVFDTTGMTADRTVLFPDEDITVLGTSSTQVVTNKTLDGNQNTFTNIDSSALKNKNKTFSFFPQSESITILQDGSNNMAGIKYGQDSVSGQHYYVLESQDPTLQDLDMQISLPLPDDFVQWQSVPLQIFIKTQTTNASENAVDMTLLGTDENAVSLHGGENMTSATGNTWTQEDISFLSVPVFQAEEHFSITLKLHAKSGTRSYFGKILLNYVGK